MATIRLVPSTYEVSNTGLTVSSASNMYTNTDSTNYGTVTNTVSGTSSYYIYLRGFNFDDVPSNAVVSSFEIKYKAKETGGSTSTSYRPRICNGTTTLTGSSTVIGTTATTYSFTGVTDSWDTISGYDEDFGVRINCRRNSRNTQSVFNIYGVEILVTYTVPVYHSVTASTNSGTIAPSGTTSVLEGDDYVLTIDVTNPTVTDNNVDVTSQLVQASSGTKVAIPNDSTVSNFTASNIGNAYDDADSTNYADLSLNGGRTGTIYLDLDTSGIPSSATIQSVSCKATLQYNRNNSSSGFTSSCQMYAGSNAKGSATSWVSAGGTDVAKTTLTLSIGSWTASEIANARFYLTATNNASSTVRHVYIYGVSFTVTYEIQGVIYTYTLTNVTADHTIVVTAGQQTTTLYFKANGSWVSVSRGYKKVNGSWVQTSITQLFDSQHNYRKGN